MKFTKEFLIEELDNYETTVSDVVTGKSRWSDCHRRVFKHEGKFYQTFYRVGSTEMQDERPYEYDKAEIDCDEVFPIEKVTVVYEKAKA